MKKPIENRRRRWLESQIAKTKASGIASETVIEAISIKAGDLETNAANSKATKATAAKLCLIEYRMLNPFQTNRVA